MKGKNIKNKQLHEEVEKLRNRVTELEDIDSIRKQAEKKVLESDKKYRTLFENSIDAIFIIDRVSEKILDCNKKAADMSGYPLMELKTMTLKELYPPEEQDIISKIFGKAAESGPLSGISGISLLRKDGICVPVEINAAAYEIGGEKCICGIVRDITLRKEMESKLHESSGTDKQLTPAGNLKNNNRLLKPAIAKTSIKEKREYERFSNGHILKGAFDIGGEVFIKNISLGGICLKTSRMLPPDTSCKMDLNDQFQKQINLAGRVVWSAAVKSRREINLPAFESGLQFTDVKNSVKKSLQTIISRFNDR